MISEPTEFEIHNTCMQLVDTGYLVSTGKSGYEYFDISLVIHEAVHGISHNSLNTIILPMVFAWMYSIQWDTQHKKIVYTTFAARAAVLQFDHGTLLYRYGELRVSYLSTSITNNWLPQCIFILHASGSLAPGYGPWVGSSHVLAATEAVNSQIDICIGSTNSIGSIGIDSCDALAEY